MTLHKKPIKTLLIGGSGFIGSHLIPILLSSGRHVTVLGRRASLQTFPGNFVSYIQGDFADKFLLDNLLESHSEVVHLAYATVPNTSFENPLSDLLENLPPTINLFSKSAKKRAKLLLVSSGGTVYGESESLIIKENFSTRPISPYGLTKLTIENYARLYSATQGLEFVCVRPSNAYGIGQVPFKGQGFISTALASVLKNKPVKIFGDYGSVRDYLYVSDLAMGIYMALEKGVIGETYNIGSGIGLSNLDVMETAKPMLSSLGHAVTIEHEVGRKFDVKRNVLDSSKLQSHTGWKPKIEITDGLKMTIDWLREING